MQTDGGRQFSKRPTQRNDCTVRALATACHVTYDRAYEAMRLGGRRSNSGAYFPPGATSGFLDDVTSLDHRFVWSSNDSGIGFHKFIAANPSGRFVLCQDDHVAAVVNGVLFDDEPWRLNEALAGWWTVTKIRG